MNDLLLRFYVGNGACRITGIHMGVTVSLHHRSTLTLWVDIRHELKTFKKATKHKLYLVMHRKLYYTIAFKFWLKVIKNIPIFLWNNCQKAENKFRCRGMLYCEGFAKHIWLSLAWLVIMNSWLSQLHTFIQCFWSVVMSSELTRSFPLWRKNIPFWRQWYISRQILLKNVLF